MFNIEIFKWQKKGNINDVSWGTKGANNPKADLGVVVAHSKVDGLLEAEVECLTERRDIEAYYDNLCKYLFITFFLFQY